MKSGAAVMGLDACWVDVCLSFRECLWRKSIHLLVDLSCFRINDSLFIKGFLGKSKLFTLVEHLGFLHKCSLQLGWFGIESVVVSPLLFEGQFLVPNASEGTHGSKQLEASNVSMG